MLPLLLAVTLALDPHLLVQRVENLLRSQTSVGEYEMEIHRPRFQRTLRFRFWDDRREDRSLVVVLAPPRDRGTVFLKIKTDLWMYLPRVRRTVRIPPSMMMNSWMGSDFTNDDVARSSSISQDYEPRILEQRGDTVVLELRPKPDAPVVWDRIVLEMLLPNLPLVEHFYNARGEEVRVITFREVKTLHGRRLPTVMEAVPLNRPGHKTVLRLVDVRFDVPMRASWFQVTRLEEISARGGP